MENEGQGKAQLFAKMAKVMGELTTFHKDAKNNFHGYGYASAAQVTEVIGRAMAKAGIAFFSSTIGMQFTEDKRYIVEYEFTFACSDTGETFSSRWFGEAVHTTEKGAKDDKALNKAATTALKYFLLNTFVVSASDDVDVDANQNQKSNRKSQDNRQHNRNQQTDNGNAPAAPSNVTPLPVRTTDSGSASTDDAWLPKVYGITEFLYEVKKHQENSINKLIRDGSITSDMKPIVAASHVFMHKANEKLRLSQDDITDQLGKSLGDYLRSGKTLQDAWQDIQPPADALPPTGTDDIPF